LIVRGFFIIFIKKLAMNIIEKLNWRYATKKFDPNQNLTNEDINKIKEIIRLSPASYGLQPYKVFVVVNQSTKAALRAVSWDQPQITDASALLVFARNKNYTTAEVDNYVDNIVETRGIPKEALGAYEGMMKHAVNSLTEDQRAVWVEKQIYLALGNLLTSLAVEGIDACPMEGFDKEKYDEILGLTDMTSVVICSVGVRDQSDDTQNYKKVRKSIDDLFEIL
jgi:nitroreductase